MVNALRKDYRNAPISKQDRTMLEYVVKLTKDATQCGPQDHDKLRAVGFDDRGILQITLIASWFNYAARKITTSCAPSALTIAAFCKSP